MTMFRKLIVVLVLAALAFSIPISADIPEEWIGPAVRLDPGLNCWVGFGGSEYEGEGFIQFSNGKRGHALYKCKLQLTVGEPKYYYSESENQDYVNILSLEGKKGMMTYQYFDQYYSEN
jgi:hypothetical protein